MKIKNKFKNIINLISDVMEAHTTALFLTDEKGDFMELYCYQSFCKKIKEKCVIKKGEGLIGWVLKEKKNLLANNYERNTQTLLFYDEDEKIKSLIAAPLPDGAGVLYVDSKKSYRFTDEKEKIFNQFSLLLYNCICEKNILDKNYLKKTYFQSFVQLDKKAEKKWVFENISSLLFENINLSHFFFVIPDHCVLTYFYDEEKKINVFLEHFKEYYSPEGILGWCIKNKKNLVTNNFNTKKSFLLNERERVEINNFVGIPLHEKDMSIVGVAGFSKKRENDTFMSKKIYWNRNEVEFFEMFANKIFQKYVDQEGIKKE